MSSSAHREIVEALDRLRSGAATLNSEQYLHLLDAIEHVSSVLQLAPRGSDPVATGVWYHHERGPALARLADALDLDGRHRRAPATGPAQGAKGPAGSATERHVDEHAHNASVIRALQQSLQNP